MKTRFLHLFTGVMFILSSGHLHACSVCFGAKGDKMTEVASWSILFLLGVLLIVLSGVGCFIYTLARRSNRVLPTALSPNSTMLATGSNQ